MLQRLINSSIAVILFIAFCLVGCGPEKKREENPEAKAIRALKSSLDSIDNIEKAVPLAEELYHELLLYTNNYPKDTLSAKFLYVAAGLNETYLNNYPQAFAHYKELTEEYPDSRFAPYALFMEGVIMERYFRKSNKAIFYLDEYIKKYPEHKMVEMAKQMMETSGVKAEDLLKRIEDGGEKGEDDNK